MEPPSDDDASAGPPAGAPPSQTPTLLEGSVLEGRYRVIEEIGEGGIGRVYRAEHLKLGHDVAIKTLLPQYAAHARMRPRFEREAKALAALSHPNIVTLTDYSVTEQGTPFLVMEMLSGETLDARLAAGPLDESVARHIAVQILDALEYAHGEGFVHRDLKPANVFLTELPTDPHHVKILDFGFVKLVSDEVHEGTALTQSGVAFGTPSYMSPEQATGDVMDARTDLYSMGVIVFEMIAGRRPFVGSLPEIVRQHLTAPPPSLDVGGRAIAATAELVGWLERAMAKERAARFEDARQMRDALTRLPTPWSTGLGAAPTLAAPASKAPTLPARPSPDPAGPAAALPSRVGATRSPARRGGLGLGLALVVLASGGAAWWFGIRPEAALEEGRSTLESAIGARPEPPTGSTDDAEPAVDAEGDEARGAAPEDAPTAAAPLSARASLLDEMSADPWWSDAPGPAASAPTPGGLEGAASAQSAPTDPDDPAVVGALEPNGVIDPTLSPESADAADEDAVDEDAVDEDAVDEDAVDEDAVEDAAEDTAEDTDDDTADEDTADEGSEVADGDELLGPNPWRTRRVGPRLAFARRRVLAGHALGRATKRALRALVRRDRSDPRPHLLIAQSLVHEGRGATALERYDLALRVDESARGDPRMLADLMRLATEPQTRVAATRMLARVYPEAAPALLDELLRGGALPDERRSALSTLRDSLGEAPATPPRRRVARRRTRRRAARAARRGRARRARRRSRRTGRRRRRR